MAERPVTEGELRAAVRKQIRFLVNSGERVAGGDPDEAVRLAVSLRVLLHDTKTSHSILGQLGWKLALQYVNSLRPLQIAPEVTVSLGTQSGDIVGETFGLVILVADDLGAMRYVAPLGREPVATTLPFDPWWNDKVLYSQGQAAFSRWDLVEAMAHRDGGAHVEPRGLTRDYEQFKLQGAGGFSIPLETWGKLPDKLDFSRATYHGDAASPTVLQIAWEVLETLNRAGLPDGPAPA